MLKDWLITDLFSFYRLEYFFNLIVGEKLGFFV